MCFIVNIFSVPSNNFYKGQLLAGLLDEGLVQDGLVLPADDLEVPQPESLPLDDAGEQRGHLLGGDRDVGEAEAVQGLRPDGRSLQLEDAVHQQRGGDAHELGEPEIYFF